VPDWSNQHVLTATRRSVMLIEDPSADLPDDFYEEIHSGLQQRIYEELRGATDVVDIGCGDCGLARYLVEAGEGWRVTGVDSGAAKLAGAEEAVEGSEGCLRCIEGDAAHLDFLADGAVEAAVMTRALHEMADAAAVLAEVKRVLRPGGKLLIVDFPRDSLAQRLWNEDYFTPDEVEEMLGSAGYGEVAVILIERGQMIWATGLNLPG